MNLRTLLFASILTTLACQLPPKPDPEPKFRVVRDDFDGFSTEFKIADNPGNTVSFDTLGHVVLSSSRNSGWIYSGSFKLAGLIIEVGLTQVSNDFCIEFSQEVFNLSDNGFYLNATRLRAYIYDLLHKLYIDFKRAEMLIVDQDIANHNFPVPGRIRLRFTADSMFYEYDFKKFTRLYDEVDSTWFDVVEQKDDWQMAFAMKESFQGDWYFALTSVGTKGITKVDYVEITAPPENFPKEPEYGNVILEWNKNTEPDVASYIAEAIGFKNARTVDTFYTFQNLPKSTPIVFRVAAEDSAGNRSAWSDTLVHKIQ